MLDLISIGTVTIDIYYKGESLTQTKDKFELAIGGKYFADHFFESLGGGGANVAIGLTKMGLKAGLVAKIGDNPFKQMIFEKLEAEKIHYKELCKLEKEYVNISSVLLSESGEKTIINYRSPHQHIITQEEDYKMLLKAGAVYLANMSDVPLKERIAVLKYAHRHLRPTFANLNVTDCRRPIEEILHFLEYVDVFIINTYEFADIVKAPYESIDFHHDVVEKYAPFRKEKVLIVTDGKKGSYGYYNGKVFHQPAMKDVKVVNTTGAGDAFTAGFIADFLTSKNIKTAMESGANRAVHILRHIGAN